MQSSTPSQIDADKFPGLLVVYTGHGKGKTTAALGMVFRALGRDFEVAVMQFIKGKWKTGERKFASTLPHLTFEVMGRGFTWESDDLGKDEDLAKEAWSFVRGWLAGGFYRLIVLDEITYALNYGFLDLDEVCLALASRPAHVHVVVTGRDAPQRLQDMAHIVTHMEPTKHIFQSGLRAQIGVDF